MHIAHDTGDLWATGIYETTLLLFIAKQYIHLPTSHGTTTEVTFTHIVLVAKVNC